MHFYLDEFAIYYTVTFYLLDKKSHRWVRLIYTLFSMLHHSAMKVWHFDNGNTKHIIPTHFKICQWPSTLTSIGFIFSSWATYVSNLIKINSRVCSLSCSQDYQSCQHTCIMIIVITIENNWQVHVNAGKMLVESIYDIRFVMHTNTHGLTDGTTEVLPYSLRNAFWGIAKQKRPTKKQTNILFNVSDHCNDKYTWNKYTA